MQPTGDSEMTDNIDQWRADFEKFIVKVFEVNKPTAEKRRDSGEYFYAHVQLAWLSYCEAKRAQKPVELPKLTDPEAERWIQEMYLCVRKFDCSIPDQTLEQMRAILKLCTVKGE